MPSGGNDNYMAYPMIDYPSLVANPTTWQPHTPHTTGTITAIEPQVVCMCGVQCVPLTMVTPL